MHTAPQTVPQSVLQSAPQPYLHMLYLYSLILILLAHSPILAPILILTRIPLLNPLILIFILIPIPILILTRISLLNPLPAAGAQSSTVRMRVLTRVLM